MNTLNRALMNIRCLLGSHTWIPNGWTGGDTYPSPRGAYRICATNRCRGILHRIQP